MLVGSTLGNILGAEYLKYVAILEGYKFLRATFLNL